MFALAAGILEAPTAPRSAPGHVPAERCNPSGRASPPSSRGAGPLLGTGAPTVSFLRIPDRRSPARIRDRWAFLVETGSGLAREMLDGRRVRVRPSRVGSRARRCGPATATPEKALATGPPASSQFPPNSVTDMPYGRIRFARKDPRRMIAAVIREQDLPRTELEIRNSARRAARTALRDSAAPRGRGARARAETREKRSGDENARGHVPPRRAPRHPPSSASNNLRDALITTLYRRSPPRLRAGRAVVTATPPSRAPRPRMEAKGGVP